ncbi:hypothetical protein [Lentzea flaviverrucosa]|uniref:Uncharacterized protein n=1 Tax=Lentzea flaviverrucosa TaxID=200379 RepID=A0A1H9MS89_9PSEU|nr:hypothetical protein [Lentzea flaviverrucosa]RDI30804.1 hypothetical protein DFR72_104136 [Lentzea flaviverrucosa]SER26574.1 hypothetical protein SAMN05216195_104491 [Lentzea flaviverrucosa]
MKFRLHGKGQVPLTIVFEPSGAEYVIPGGGHVVVEFEGDGEGEISVYDDHATPSGHHASLDGRRRGAAVLIAIRQNTRRHVGTP